MLYKAGYFNKKMKKIAVISSSPLMMILAKKLLEKGNEITVFDISQNKGGAWAWHEKLKKNLKKYFPKYSNAIVPLNKKEEKFIPKMNKILEKSYKVKVLKTKKKIITNYKFRNNYIYDFSNFYDYAVKNLNFRKLFISDIKTLKNNKVMLNNSLTYDKVYISSYTGVKKIHNFKIKKTFRLKCKEIVSEHIFIYAKKFKLENFYYSDFFDDEFDRVKIDKINNHYSLTSRLAHKIKNKGLSKIKKKIHKFVNKRDVFLVKLSKFHNYYRTKEQLKILKKATYKSNINYVDTTQFVCGFYFLRKIL